MKKSVILLIIAGLLLMSCAQNQNGQGTMFGTGIGAAGGAVLGQVIGKSTGATLIGAAVGGLLGYAVATHIESQTKQVYDTQQTKAMIPAAQRSEPLLQIRKKSISPANKFQAGENVTVQVTYLIFDENMKQITVIEESSIWHKGEMVQVIDNIEKTRESGTYKSQISFNLPGEIEKGEYELRHDIQTDFAVKDSSLFFTVI